MIPYEMNQYYIESCFTIFYIDPFCRVVLTFVKLFFNLTFYTMKMLIIFCVPFFMSLEGFPQDAESMKELDKTIRSYSTFGWVSDINEIPDDQAFVGPDGVLIFNNESARKMIQEAIRVNLQSKGYTMNEDNPDMLIGFQVLEQQADFTTYTGYETTYLGLDTVRTEENLEEVTVGPGTLLINITDTETSAVAWQGYAPGALDDESVKSEQSIRSAVSEIMSEFDYTAFSE